MYTYIAPTEVSTMEDEVYLEWYKERDVLSWSKGTSSTGPGDGPGDRPGEVYI
jgi:hypothetical protein